MSLRAAAIVWSVALNAPWPALADSPVRIKPFFDLRYQYEDNVFQVPKDLGEQRDSAAYIWTGVDVRAALDPRTRIAVRYEMAPRRFFDLTRKNRYDHLLSALWRRRLSPDATLLGVANLGLRHQPNDRINEYFKQDISGQLQVRWNPSWSSRFGAELRNKHFPNSEGSTYSSVMVEGGLRRRFSAIAHLSAGYQVRAYRGAIDPRIIMSGLDNLRGTRQTASLEFEGMALGRVLLNLKYQFEIDLATRALPHHDPLSREPEQRGEFGHHDGDGDDVDFNFASHRAGSFFIWRFAPRSNASLAARHHFKSYQDWIVPGTGAKRRDNLTLLRLGLKQDLSEDLGARLEYAFVTNDSNDATRGYADNTYSVQLQYSF